MALTVRLSSCGREELTSWARSSSVRAGLAQRARIVLLAAEWMAVKEIVERHGGSSWFHPHAFVYVHRYSDQCGDAGRGRERYSVNYYPES